MRRLIATIFTVLLVAPSASAGQEGGKPSDWQHAQTLTAGTEIVITAIGGGATKVRLLFADETHIVTLRPAAPKLPAGAQKFLLEVGPKWSSIINDGGTYTFEPLRVSQNGIFDGDKKLADLADVIQQTPRADVREILKPSARKRHVWTGLAIGAGAGALGGFALLVSDDAGEAMGGEPVILAGIAGGIGAAIGAILPAGTKVVYRAPGASSSARLSLAPVITSRTKGVALSVSF